MLGIRRDELKNAHKSTSSFPPPSSLSSDSPWFSCSAVLCVRLKRWLRERAVTKMALATELRGDLTKEEEVLLRTQVILLPVLSSLISCSVSVVTQLKEKEEKTKKLQRANEESQRKVQSMDDAFMKIKQITGMTSLDDMLEKFTAQKINKKNLEKEHAEVEVKLNDAKKMIAKVEQVSLLSLGLLLCVVVLIVVCL
jgi:hypothetical protein